MTETVMNTNALPSFLTATLKTNRVRVRENNRVVTIEPIEEKSDCTAGLRGILADYPEMSVERFLERKHADKEFDR
jgi:virulence-associated protein VagC